MALTYRPLFCRINIFYDLAVTLIVLYDRRETHVHQILLIFLHITHIICMNFMLISSSYIRGKHDDTWLYKTNFKSVVESIPETGTLFYLLYILNNVCLTYLLVSYIWIITIENVNMWSFVSCVVCIGIGKKRIIINYYNKIA